MPPNLGITPRRASHPMAPCRGAVVVALSRADFAVRRAAAAARHNSLRVGLRPTLRSNRRREHETYACCDPRPPRGALSSARSAAAARLPATAPDCGTAPWGG